MRASTSEREQQATFDISVFEHGSEAFGSKLQIFQVSFVPQFSKETQIQRKQHQIQKFDPETSEPCQNIDISNMAYQPSDTSLKGHSTIKTNIIHLVTAEIFFYFIFTVLLSKSCTLTQIVCYKVDKNKKVHVHEKTWPDHRLWCYSFALFHNFYFLDTFLQTTH